MISVNGHFTSQMVTGVQRYALEVLREFKRLGVAYRLVEPPEMLRSDALRQLWMQIFMTRKATGALPLWSPTNTGPISHPKHILTLHDLADQLHPEWFSRSYTRWRSLILPVLIRRVQRVITVSEYSRKTILDLFPFAESKIEVIAPGVNGGHFYKRPNTEVSAIRKEMRLERPYVITVGSLDPRKNLKGLLKAWNLLPPRIRQDRNLLVVGGSSGKFAFLIEEEPDETVRFAGYIPDERLAALYSGAEVFVYPSLFEGFGLPVLEAMACGIPVVTSGTTALAELPHGTAWTVDPQKPTEIAEAIHMMLERPPLRSEHIKAGLEYVQRFSWETTARRTVRVIESVA